jgi:hypothetical protein
MFFNFNLSAPFCTVKCVKTTMDIHLLSIFYLLSNSIQALLFFNLLEFFFFL